MKLITDKKIILASESPRRKELFSSLGIPFEVQPSGVVEELEGVYDPEQMAIAIADLKATEVFRKNPDAIVIAADTTVRIGKALLSKPTSNAQAKKFMKLLSGKVHNVITGVTILGPGISIAFAESTLVKFYELSNKEIDAYVESGDPLDKAGGYGIQTMGGLFVEKIQGDYNNVVGLPISRLYRTLVTLEVIEFEKEKSK
ncbi:septum formation protein Maf [Psychrobacillus glaciei]|uniref:dTTP/UTP pyrophosphatase n=1 Tax=Psychrobacillus glaciei TaxID=2283160 RepID=A0A5J6SRU0_9BACI|nr:Maf family protein [Psychrobacillus glaciei]QFF99564.1 septum formation protein Maf [Psychrobacillus glaciei]